MKLIRIKYFAKHKKIKIQKTKKKFSFSIYAIII